VARIAYDEFQAAIRRSRRAWHIEMSDTYNVEIEDEAFGRFLAGAYDDYLWLSEWRQFIAEVTAAGTRVQRARVVTVPHSDYTRWGLAVAQMLEEAGEQIRYLRRDQAGGIPFPKEDFWVFDEDRLILSVFSADGRQGGFASSEDPDLLDQCREVRDLVWARATPYAKYVASTS